MKALSKSKRGLGHDLRGRAPRRGLHRHRLPGPARLRPGHAARPGARCWPPPASCNFTPSRLGRSLAEGRHAANGIVFPDLSGPTTPRSCSGTRRPPPNSAAACSSWPRTAARTPSPQVLELAGRVDGMVVMGRTVGDDVIATIAASGTAARAPRPRPGRRSSTPSGPRTPHRRGARRPPRRARVPAIGVPRRSGRLAGRGRAVRRASRGAWPRAGVRAPRLVPCMFDVEAGLRGGSPAAAHGDASRRRSSAPTTRWPSASSSPPSELGLAIPGDLALTGWDDVMTARFVGLTHRAPTDARTRRHRGAHGCTTASRTHSDPRRTTARPRRQVLPTQLVDPSQLRLSPRRYQ